MASAKVGRFPWDLGFSLFIMFAAVWVYELGNYVALSALGAAPSIVLQGIIPVATVVVEGEGAVSIWAKPLQVLFSLACSVPGYYLARTYFGPISRVASISTMSVFLASFYWESLSSVASVSITLHIVVFALLAGLTQFSLLKLTRATALPN